MRRFAALYDAIDATTSTNAKVAALAGYFRDAPPGDAAWAVFFLTGRKLRRLIPSALLREWAQAAAGIPEWLFRESYAAAGDFAELMALVLDAVPAGPRASDVPLKEWVEARLMQLPAMDEARRQMTVVGWWLGLARNERFVLNKLITSEFRVGVAQTLVIRALALASGVEVTTIAARLMGDWTPLPEWFASLIDPSSAAGGDPSRPYPFFLASPLEGPPEDLGPRDQWLVEWKWDGIRAQLIRRGGTVWLWSRGEELITQRFPEIAAAATYLPDGLVLDGEVLAFDGSRPLPFSALQHRIGRQKPAAQILRDVPVVFVAYDLLERRGDDVRAEPLATRRAWLETLLTVPGVLRLSEAITAPDWDTLAALRRESRDRGVEGFMIKRLDAPYGVGRRKGAWWKWKIDPLTVDAVLMYAQPGNGRRASLLTDYTFGVWDRGRLVPVAKAYSGLSNEEIAELDAWIRRHTVERHGPVRAVEPLHVFELGFEGIAPSSRHKSGVAVRFPRMLRWRRDKAVAAADTLEMLRGFIARTREPG